MPSSIVSLVPVLDLSWSVLRANFQTPIGNARTSWASRETVLLLVRDADGREGRGEAAPLPGVSIESLDDVLAALEKLGTSIVPSELDLATLPPSLRFGLDAALLGLQATTSLASQLVSPDLAPRIAAQIDVQILLSDVDLQRASDARKEGAFAFKVKLGKQGEVDAECTLLRHLRSMGRDVVIRADANSKDFDAALVHVLREVQAEYVEDPAPATRAMLHRAGVHVAIDECVLREADEALDEILHARATTLVIKPSLLGSIERTFTLAARARARGGNIVLSHAMESPIGLATLHQIAFAMSASAARTLTPQGLAPWPGIETFAEKKTGEPISVPHRWTTARIPNPQGNAAYREIAPRLSHISPATRSS